MGLTQILIIIGVIGGIILLIVALRGSFKSDDAFYGESPPMPDKAPTAPDAGPSADDGQGQVPPGGSGGDAGERGGTGAAGGGS